MTDKEDRRSWNLKVPTDGGPVSYLNIYDRQSDIRIPEDMPMTTGCYRYEYGIYHWIPAVPDA